jgi:hypothetical protein
VLSRVTIRFLGYRRRLFDRLFDRLHHCSPPLLRRKDQAATEIDHNWLYRSRAEELLQFVFAVCADFLFLVFHLERHVLNAEVAQEGGGFIYPVVDRPVVQFLTAKVCSEIYEVLFCDSRNTDLLRGESAALSTKNLSC